MHVCNNLCAEWYLIQFYNSKFLLQQILQEFLVFSS